MHGTDLDNQKIVMNGLIVRQKTVGYIAIMLRSRAFVPGLKVLSGAVFHGISDDLHASIGQ